MGQKVNPNSFRLQIRKDWQSVWYTDNNSYSKLVGSDFLIRQAVNNHYKNVSISKVVIERSDTLKDDSNSLSAVQVSIYCSNRGHIIGKSGKEIETLSKILRSKFPNTEFVISLKDVHRGEADAMTVAKNIVMQLEKRGNYKRIIKRALESAMKFDNCLGIKITASGRLAGAEIAKSEIFKVGSIPLHKLSADINYGLAEAKTTYGIIGIKTWVYLSD